MTRLLTMVFVTLILALTGLSGCGSDDCSDACGKIYGECKMAIEGMPQAQCVTECNADKDQNVIDCVMKASCDETALSVCLQ